MSNGVEVRFFAAARAAAGLEKTQCSSAAFESIIAELCRDNPSLSLVMAQCSFLLDSIAVHDQSVIVKNGSVIDVLPRFAGG